MTVAQLEVLLTLKDQLSPAMASASKAAAASAGAMAKAEQAVKGLDAQMGKAGKSADQWSEANQRAALRMERMHEEALKMNAEMKNVNDGAVRTAGNMRMAGESFDKAAKSVGVSTDAMRVLGPASDVASTGMAGLTKSAVGFNAASIGIAAAGFSIGTAIGSWLNTFPAVQKAADSLFHSMFRFVGLAGEIDKSATEGIGAFSAKIAATNAEAQKKQVEGLRAQGVAAKDIAKLYGSTMTTELQKQLGLTKEAVKAEEDRAAAAKRSAEAFKDLTDSLSGRKAQAEADNLLRAFTKEGGASGIANIEAFRKKLEGLKAEGAKISDKGLLALLSGGKVTVPDFDLGGLDLGGDTANLMERVSKTGLEAARSWKEMAAAGLAAKIPVEQIADAMERAGASSDQVKNAFAALAKPTGFMDSLKAGFKDLPAVILGAIQGGGDVFKAAGASIFSKMFAEGTGLAKTITGGLSKVLGSGIGGALGSIVPVLGTMLGSALGGLVSKGISAIGSKLGIGGNKAIMQLNDTRDAFLSSKGGFEALQKQLVGLSNQDLVKKIFDAKTVKEFDAAVSEVNRLLSNQAEANERLQEAVEKYGFTVEELGPKFRQQELDTMAGELLQDYELLKASGIDLNLINEKMAPNMSEYVQTAIRAGSTIPEAMRGVIDAMIANGQLLDENGQAYASAEAAGITFAQTMSEQFSTLIQKIGDLVAALTGIPNVSRDVTINTREFRAPAGEEDFSGVPEDYRAATGFHAMVRKPTRILVGESGPERVDVTPQGQAGGGGMGGPSITIAPNYYGNPLQTNESQRDLADYNNALLMRGVKDSPLIRATVQGQRRNSGG
jgi:hypothetical protein